MKITAIGLPALPPHWAGRVHSVFQNSCNIARDTGPLITIHCFESGTLPCSFFVPDLLSCAFRQGEAVHASERHIQIGDRILQWAEHVETVNTSIPRVTSRPGPLSREVLNRRRSPNDASALEAEIYRRLRRALRLLWEGLLAGDREQIRRQCKACVGFGQGLTPTGDDMLLGTFAALHMYAPELVPSLAGEVLPLMDRTGDISRSYLHLAADGYAATPVISAAESLCTGDMAAVEALLEIGHSSGGDILEGLFTAVPYLRRLF